MSKAKFITLEGTEGSGKSTNLNFICEYLQTVGQPYLVTREPGGTEVAEKIRELLLMHHEESVDPLCELLLIFAARAQHIEKKIKPALASGKWVISDRFTDATYAYQGGGRGLGFRKIEWLENFVQGELRPDKTIFLNIHHELGMQRIKKRAALDRFESEPSSFFESIRQSYLKRIEEKPERYAHIDASRQLSDVQLDIKNVLDQLLAESTIK